MKGRLSIAGFARLRKILAMNAPEWFAAAMATWQDWQDAAAASLPDGRHPQVYAMAHITCIDDIPCHAGFLQVLRCLGAQAFPVFILPSQPTVDFARRAALREGWASLAAFACEADTSGIVSRLPGDALLFRFPQPGPLPERLLRGALDGKNVSLGFGASVGAASCVLEDLHSRTVHAGPADIAAFAEALQRFPWAKPGAALGHCGRTGAVARPSVSELELWMRQSSIELPGTGDDDWMVAVVKDAAGPAQVVARQPAGLADLPENLTVPLPPRLASGTIRTMQVHRVTPNGVASGPEMHFNVPAQRIAPWMVSAYLNRGGAGNPVIEAFAQGLGCRLAYAEDEEGPLRDIPVVWGVLRGSDRILAQAKAQGLYFFYIDHAYFDRGHGQSYRITRNAYEAGRVRKVDDRRLKGLNLEIQPWRKAGRSIIVCPPTEHFAAAHNCQDWLEKTLATIRLETDRPIIVRTKPRPGEKSTPLAQALLDAHALVTHSSNVAIEAVCLGTPVFVSPTSAAAQVGHTDLGLINTPRYPKRDGWLCHLAYSQYTIDEIRDGTAWKLLMYLEDRAFV